MKFHSILFFFGLGLFFFTSCIREDIVDFKGTVTAQRTTSYTTIEPGGTLQASANFEENGVTYTEYDFTWTSSNESVATVDSSGLVTGVSKGSTRIEAKVFDFVSPPFMVHVVDDTNAVFSISAANTNRALSKDGTLQLQLEALNINGNPTTADGNYTYTSDNDLIATVSATGLVTGVSTGQVSIEVIAPDANTINITVNVVDDQNAVATVEISGGTTMLMTNEFTTLSIAVKNINGEEINNPTIVWASSDDNILTVDGNGKVTTIGEGTAEISATVDGVISNSFEIMVMDRTSQMRTATLERIDYDTEGTAILELTTDNDLKLVFQDFNSPQALQLPGVVVYLSNSLNASDAKNNGLEVGAVPQTSGNFTMNINSSDPTLDFAQYDYVFLICKPFTIAYGGGELSN